jgi:hypothetical protein
MTKMGWATFWAIFSKTHVVILRPKRSIGWSFSWNSFNESHSFVESVTFVERLKRLSTKVTLSMKE